MRIGIDASRANALTRTGTEWYSYHLIQQFKALIPPENEVILYLDRELAKDLLPLPQNFTYRILLWPPVFLWTQIRLSWEMLIRPPDILFIPSHTLPFFHPRHSFVTLHDVGFERFAKLYSQQPIGPQKGILKFLFALGTRIITLGKYRSTELDYHRWSTRHALRKAKKIFTISKFSKSEICELFGKKYQDKIEIVPISFDANLFQTKFSQAEINQTLTNYKINRPYLFFIGRLEEKKNIKGLIEIFNILKSKYQQDLLLIMAGQPGYGFSKIEQKIKEYRLNDSIIQLNNPTEKERAILMQSAAVFVFPSLYEGFGIPPLEAMAAGTPVVASSAAAIPEVSGNAAILVDPNDWQLFAEKIHLVLNNEHTRNKLITLGKKQIQNYSWERCSQRILDIIFKSEKQDLPN